MAAWEGEAWASALVAAAWGVGKALALVATGWDGGEAAAWVALAKEVLVREASASWGWAAAKEAAGAAPGEQEAGQHICDQPWQGPT